MKFINSTNGFNKLIPFKIQNYFYFWVSICFLIILQDYAFSVIKHIPFYWSEVLLFKIYWLLFIPFSIAVFYFNIKLPLERQNFSYSIPLHILFSIFLTFVQLFLFAVFVSGISQLFSDYPFYFYSIFTKTLARDFYLNILVYWFLIILQHYFSSKTEIFNDFKIQSDASQNFAKFIHLRKGKELIPIDVKSINWIDKEQNLHLNSHQQQKISP